MVLRLILIFTIVSSSAFAQSNRTIYLKKAQRLFSKGKVDASLKMLNKYYNLKSPSKLPPSVLNLLGLAYLKKKQFRLSAKLFHLVIRKRYFNIHKRIVSNLSLGTLDDVEVPVKLQRIYYHLGQAYYYIHSKTNDFNYFNASRSYFRICENKSHLSSSTGKYLASLNEKLEYIQSLEKKATFYLSGGGILFQEKISLINDSDSNDSVDLIANNEGVCLGGGMTYGNIKHGWDLYGCAFTAAASITNKVGSSVTYKQNDVPVTGFYLSPGYYYRPYDKLTSIGFSAPLFFRQGNYSNTDNYSIKAQGQLSAGIALDAKWGFYSDYTFDFKITNLGSSNIFMSNLSYHF